MDTLQEWYAYLDRVSRPARRDRDDAPRPQPSGWRPWVESPPPDTPGDALRPEDMPLLSPILGGAGLSVARQGATREFEDPTLHDELAPIPEMPVPQLEAPEFQVEIPSLKEAFSAARGAASAESAGSGPQDAEDAASGREAKAAPGSLRARAWALLEQLQDEPGESDRGKSGTRESREELVRRLTEAADPTLTLEQAAVLLGVCPTTVRRYTNRGYLRHFRTKGNQRRFRLSDVLEFMENRTAIEADEAAEGA